MREFLRKLKEKYSYDKELLKFIEDLFPALLVYYGMDKKDLIMDAFLNCEIHFQDQKEKLDDYLNDYFKENRQWNTGISSAFYYKNFSADEGKILSKSIIYMKYPFDLNNHKDVQCFVHELCHMIKGYKTEKYNGNAVIDRTGLSTTYYENKGNGFVETNDSMNGIEEAFNECDATVITSMYTGKELEPHSYKNAARIAVALRNKDKEFFDKIQKSQFSGDDSWIEYIGEEKAKELVEKLDLIASTPPYEILINKEKRRQFIEKQNEAIDSLYEFIYNRNNKSYSK